MSSKEDYIQIEKQEFEKFREILLTIKSDLVVLEKENRVRFNIEQFLEKLNKDFCEVENFITKLAERL